MKKEDYNKAKELEEYLKIIDSYLQNFNPKCNVVYLHIKDMYGNGNTVLDLYAHNRNKKDKNSQAIGYKHDNFTKHYKEFLQKCTDDLLIRRKELEEEFNKL